MPFRVDATSAEAFARCRGFLGGAERPAVRDRGTGARGVAAGLPSRDDHSAGERGAGTRCTRHPTCCMDRPLSRGVAARVGSGDFVAPRRSPARAGMPGVASTRLGRRAVGGRLVPRPEWCGRDGCAASSLRRGISVHHGDGRRLTRNGGRFARRIACSASVGSSAADAAASARGACFT